MIEFRKVMNRSMPLFSCQYWHEGEKFGLPAVCENVCFFDHVFVYKKGFGTGVYYNFTDSKQDHANLTHYFNQNHEKFDKLAETYQKDVQHILELVEKKDPAYFSEIYQLLIKTFPMLTASNVIGKDETAEESLRKKAFDLRSKNDQVTYQAGYALFDLAKEKIGDSEIIDFLTFEEIRSENIPSIEEIEERKQGYIYYNRKLYLGEKMKNFEEKEGITLVNEEAEETNQIKGTIAQKGKTAGKAKIVFETNQLNKVEKGDILVTPMTTPDFLPAMQKASAFVTDEGGVTCHAAIISREMKKPCIIGTKIATRVLKDGDWIEVDADNGIVRKIQP